ncbi:unnamed protein product, partial [Meganyctiphanes norvegica]
LLEEGADINIITKNDVSPLWVASHKGYVDIVETLLQKNAQLYITSDSTDDIWQAIHISAYEGNLKVIMKLKEYGCDLNATTSQNNCTPLHLTVQEGILKVAEWLVMNGANPHACDQDGNTPIQIATMKRY